MSMFKALQTTISFIAVRIFCLKWVSLFSLVNTKVGLLMSAFLLFKIKIEKGIWCGQMLREIVTYRKGRAKAIEFLEDLKGKIIFFLANGKHKNFWLKKKCLRKW